MTHEESRSKIMIFAGTTEGRLLASELTSRGIPITISTATEYGRTVLEPHPLQEIRSGRMTYDEMLRTLGTYRFVIDATHPFAREVTDNIKKSCERLGIFYLRVIRKTTDFTEECYVSDLEAAIRLLAATEGPILVTTGSKELVKYKSLPQAASRVYARVLPTHDALDKAAELGLTGSHIIAMQGPFTEELNLALIRQLGIRYLVTKDSGTVGGVDEKLSACKKAGIQAIIIGRPEDESGFYPEEALRILLQKTGGSL